MIDDPTDLKSQREAEQATTRENRIIAATRDNDLRIIMSQAFGRRFVYRILEDAATMRTSWNPNFGQMAFAEGRKQVGYRLIEEIQRVCPEDYLTMMREAEEEQQS